MNKLIYQITNSREETRIILDIKYVIQKEYEELQNNDKVKKATDDKTTNVRGYHSK